MFLLHPSIPADLFPPRNSAAAELPPRVPVKKSGHCERKGEHDGETQNCRSATRSTHSPPHVARTTGEPGSSRRSRFALTAATAEKPVGNSLLSSRSTNRSHGRNVTVTFLP